MKIEKNDYGTFALTDEGEFQILDRNKIDHLIQLGYCSVKLAVMLEKAENKLRRRR